MRSTTRLRTLSLLIVAGATACLLAACAGGGQQPAPTSDPEMAPIVTTHEDVDALTLGFDAKFTTLDPLMISWTQDCRLMHLLGGTLFALDPSGGPATPSLADHGELSADGLGYTVTIKDDAAFTDGTPVTSADVVATFDRALNLPTNAYIGQVLPITNLDAPDATTVVFTFDRPYPYFETFLAYPNMAILKASEIGSDLQIPEKPTFAGAYVLNGDLGSTSLTLTRHDAFAGDLPAVAELILQVVGDPNARVQQVKTGQLDLAIDPLPAQIGSLGAEAVPQIAESYGFYYLNMNNVGSMADMNLRKAISAAIDRDQISRLMTAGYGSPIDGFFPKTFLPSQTAAPRDIDAAKELIADSSCADGCELSIMAIDETAQQAAAAIQQYVEEIGVTIKVEGVEPVVSNQRLFDGEFDMVLLVFGDYSTAPEGLPAYCMQFDAGYLSCMSSYASPDADAAVNDLKEAIDDAAVTTAMDDLEKVFRADQPYATLANLIASSVLSKEAVGVVSIGASNLLEVARLEK